MAETLTDEQFQRRYGQQEVLSEDEFSKRYDFPSPPTFGSRLWESVNPLPAFKAIFSPIETGKAMIGHTAQRIEQMKEALKQGQYPLAAGRALQSIPIIGSAAEVGELIAQDLAAGRPMAAAGSLAGLAAPLAVSKAGAIPKLAGVRGTQLMEAATKQYEQALGATTKPMKYLARKVIPGLLEQREWSFTRKGLLAKAGAKAEQAASELEDAYDALTANQQVQIKPILQTLEDKKAFYVLPNGTIGNEKAFFNLSKMQGQIVKKLGGLEATVDDVRKFRQLLDEQVAEAKGYMGKTLKEGALIKAQKKAADSIRNELAAEFPDIASINKTYNFWRNVQTVLTETLERTGPQATPMSQQLGRVVGAVAGSKQGISGAIIGTYLGKKTIELISSPGWRMISATQKAKLANLLATGKSGLADKFAAGLLTRQVVEKQSGVPVLPEPPSQTPESRPIEDQDQADVRQMIEQEADRQNVPRPFALALAESESSFRHLLEPGPKGEIGVMQIIPKTADYLKVDPRDLRQNIEGGIRLLSQKLRQHKGNVLNAYADYKGGMNVPKAMENAKLAYGIIQKYMTPEGIQFPQPPR